MEGTSDSDVVGGRDVVNWKAWNGTDVVDGRDGDRKGRLEGALLLEETIDTDFDWKGWIRTSIGRDAGWKDWKGRWLEGLDTDAGWKGR